LLADPELAAHVTARLEAKDSPMRFAIELADGTFDLGATVSHEVIYLAVHVQGTRCLAAGPHRHLHRRRRRRKHNRPPGDVGRLSPLGVFRSISERPEQAQSRDLPGHLEGDLIIGAKGASAVITIFDRCTRHCLLADLPEGHTKDATLAALIELLDRLPAHRRLTLTWDQGTEMARWVDLEQATGITVYFADPHSHWQRGINENGNGLLRRWLPKGTDLFTHTPQDLRAIENRINTKPRRSIGRDTTQVRRASIVSYLIPLALDSAGALQLIRSPIGSDMLGADEPRIESVSICGASIVTHQDYLNSVPSSGAPGWSRQTFTFVYSFKDCRWVRS